MQTALTPELPRWQLTGRAERATTCNAGIADELPSVQRNDNAITIVESLRFAAHVARYVQRMTAGSTGRRNTSVKSLCWGFKLQGLTWSFV